MKSKRADKIILEKPDGIKVITTIDGFEIPIPNPRNMVWIFLKFTEDKSVIPIGTKVLTKDLDSTV